jgi:hypothetical protein
MPAEPQPLNNLWESFGAAGVLSLSVAMSEDLWLLLVASWLHGYINHRSGEDYAFCRRLRFLKTFRPGFGPYHV